MRVLTVHDGKGQKDRTALLPEALVPELQAQLERAAQGHEDVRTTMIYTHTVRSITLSEKPAGFLGGGSLDWPECPGPRCRSSGPHQQKGLSNRAEKFTRPKRHAH